MGLIKDTLLCRMGRIESPSYKYYSQYNCIGASSKYIRCHFAQWAGERCGVHGGGAALVYLLCSPHANMSTYGPCGKVSPPVLRCPNFSEGRCLYRDAVLRLPPWSLSLLVLFMLRACHKGRAISAALILHHHEGHGRDPIFLSSPRATSGSFPQHEFWWAPICKY